MRMKQKKKSFEEKSQNGQFFKIANSGIFFFRKFHRLILGLVGLIDAKAINVAQPIWS